VKKIVMALVAGMLVAGPALAQNNMGVGPQQRNTKMTTTKVMEIGPDGLPFEKTETVNENLPTERTNARGKYQYSGIPGKFMRGKEAQGGQTGTAQ
jgi:hypothetical protein